MTWKRLWARKFSPFIMSAFMMAFKKKDGFGRFDNVLVVPEGRLYCFYHSSDEFYQMVENYTRFLMKQDIGRYAKQFEHLFKEYLAWAKQFGKQNFRHLTRNELITSLNELFQKTSDLAEPQFLAFVVNEGPAAKIEQEILNTNILQAITTPDKNPQITKARLELVKLVKNGKTDDAALNEYTKKYAWLPVYEFSDKPLTLEDVKKQVSIIENPEIELTNFANHKREGLRNYRIFVKTVKDPQRKKLIEIVHYFSYVKEMRDDYRRQAYYLLRPFWQEIARRTNLTLSETNYLLLDELVEILKIGKNRYEKRISARQKAYSLLLKNGKLTIYDRDISKEMLGKQTTHTQQLSGTVGNPGIVTGPAKIVFHRGEFDKFKPGDILVTTMTHPEFLPIMKQAAAIVTDEGGITSHAAIVARELGKPCIIGTKVATKVLKDGDRVEVDADRSIVRKIS